jgi:hypothetical protein
MRLHSMPTPIFWLTVVKFQNVYILRRLHAPAPASKVIRLVAAQAPAPQHWHLLYYILYSIYSKINPNLLFIVLNDIVSFFVYVLNKLNKEPFKLL